MAGRRAIPNLPEYKPNLDLVPKILVVDDLKINRLVLIKILSEMKCEIIEAECGAEAIELAKGHSFALMLLDVHMPEMTGFELAAHFQKNKDTEEVPIVFVTAAANDVKSELQGYDLGAVDYIEKPIEIPILLAKVKVFIELFEQKAWLQSLVVELQEVNDRLSEEIDHRMEMEEKLRTMALTDSLTGLYNRRALMDSGNKELAKIRRGNAPMVLALIDIDFFKKVNDTYGHDAGDAALVTLAKFAKDFFRTEDTVARIGGEEFTILCPAGMEASNVPGILSRIEDFRKAVETVTVTSGDASFQMTLSIGVVIAQNNDRGMDALLSAADVLLYQAKEGGRNQVVYEQT